MDAEEIGRLIGELENRVERLRSLYEQYFMGIERLEPLTVRKDVDRRLWALRREQIRNTGLRFKLETTIQRYNTYQQYWQRIVREIEAGTYQRDLGRAAQRFGDNAVTGFARRRQKMFENAVSKKAERDARRTGAGASSPAPPEETGDEAPPSSNETYDVTFEDAESAEPAATRGAPIPPAEPIEPLELDIGFGAPPGPPPHEPHSVAARPVAPGAPPPPRAKPVTPAAMPAKPAAVKPAAPAATPAKPLAAAGGGTQPAIPGAPPKPATPLATPAQPVMPPAGARQDFGTPAKLGALAPNRPPAPTVSPTGGGNAPVAAAKPPAPSSSDARGPAVLSEDNNLSPIRMRQIYGAFVEAKRRANESTASVTYEKIASNLENVAKELRAKHKARSVDFEVVLKNGKPVLKPVVKG